MKITFNNHTFEVRQNEKGLFSLKDIEKGWKESGGKGKLLKDWANPKRSADFALLSQLSDFTISGIKGNKYNGAGTWGNKMAVIEYASHCSLAFRVAVTKTFEALISGNTQEAINLAGSVAIDMQMVEDTRTAWKAFIGWSYQTFGDVNKFYGGNLTKLIMSKSIGISTNASIKGLTRDNVIDKLVAQGRGDAILSLQATIKLAGKYLRTSDCKMRMGSVKGKKEVYSLLKEFLEF